MKQRPQPPKSFDQLLRGHYGVARGNVPSLDLADQVIANYYGRSVARPQAPRVFVSLDTGEVLPQRHVVRDHDDYVGARGAVIDLDPEEYVVRASAPAWSQPASVLPPADNAEAVAPFQEYLVDLREPLREPPAASASPAVEAPARAAPELAPEASAAQAGQAQAPSAPASQQQATDDDFMADMKSILTGHKVYDPTRGKTVERDQLARPASVAEHKSDAPPPPSNATAIFDRIAQSMAFANAYDVGTVELENRFADFDKIEEVQRKAQRDARTGNGKPRDQPAAGTADFVEDLQAIRAQAAAPASAPGSSQAEAPYSQPFYDTGEHVLAGGDLYPDRLRLGTPPGVLFSYGQIIALGDLYEDVKQTLAADPAELRQIKDLIAKSTAYYQGHKRDPSLDVSDDMWEAATRERYLDLAEVNYEHFSPHQLFKNVRYTTKHGNYKTAWEDHHRRAIEEAQRAFLSARNQSVFPEGALIINAFGDHFLTDAFSSGHIINKEEITAAFRQNFIGKRNLITGNTLTLQAEAFFGRVAELAFKGELKRKFSVLETYDPVFLWWNPNVDTVNAFRLLLVKAMNEKPDQVANLAVKALHDHLNREGIEVSNEAGDPKWKLFGDVFLEPKTLAIMKRAVAQSAANIVDPVIQASNLNFEALFARVWRHVPQLTDASRARVAQLAVEYTRPESELLRTAAADLITRKVDAFIKKLKKLKKLKDA